MQKVLVLAPHTDDAELGCGGTIARLVEEGVEVHVAAFSTADESAPAGSAPGRLGDEFQDAMRSYGIPQERTSVHGFPVRRFAEHRQDLLDALIVLRREIAPDTVLLPSTADVHQDHQVVSAEGIRAFKDVTVWGYELPWNHVTFSANAFVTLQERHLEAQWQALSCYRSQVELGRPYFSRRIMESLAAVRGIQVKTTYAEAFEVIRVKM